MQESRTSSPLARTDAPQEHRAADPARDPRHAHALALQRSAGNRATTRLISREVRTIQGESVHVHSDAQARSAERIIKRIRRRYPEQGLAFSHDGPKLEMVEAFPPTTLEDYRATLYRDPPRFVI